MPPKARTAEERFWEKVDQSDGPNACWPWMGSRSHDGYPAMSVGGKAHQRVIRITHVALELAGRPLQPGQIACHHCDNPPCVNPAHLWGGTPAENTADMFRKGRNRKPVWSKESRQRMSATLRAGNIAHPERIYQRMKTHCPQGHPYSPENTYFYSNGSRMCRTCNRNRSRARYRKTA